MWMYAELLMQCKSNLPGGRCDVRLLGPMCVGVWVCVCVCAEIKRQHELQPFTHGFTHGLKAKCRSHTVTRLLALPPLCPSFSVEAARFSFTRSSLSTPLAVPNFTLRRTRAAVVQPADELTSVTIPLSLCCHLHHGAGSLGGSKEDGGDVGGG